MTAILDRSLFNPPNNLKRRSPLFSAILVLAVITTVSGGIAFAARADPEPFRLHAASVVSDTADRLIEFVRSRLADIPLAFRTFQYERDAPSAAQAITPSPKTEFRLATSSMNARAETGTGAGTAPTAPVGTSPERVTERPYVIQQVGISDLILESRLSQLENKLRALIFAQGSQHSAQTSAVHHIVSQSQRIDRLAGAAISGGTITNAAISGGSLSGVSFSAADISGTLRAAQGGTGTSSAPAYGQLLLGNGSGGFDLVATSSLGLAAGAPAWGSIAGTLSNQADLHAALDGKLSLSAWYATSTDALAEGATHLYFSNARADARINATSTIGTLTSAPRLATVATSLSGFLKATAGALAAALIDLAADVTGILPVENGGTGLSAVASGALLYGNGGGALATTSAGTSGYVLAYLNGLPTWTATTTFSAPLSYNGGTVALPAASASSAGYISASDWTTFHAKFATTSADHWLTTKSTDNLAEGGNLYYTLNRVASAVAGTTTDALREGAANFYWTPGRFDTAFGGKTTDNLAEGSANKYYTDARVGSYISASSSIPHVGGLAYGDVLYWTGSMWSRAATSSLGLAGGAPAWGSIAGTLSNQADLHAALDGKLSLSAWYATSTDALSQGVTNKYYDDELVNAFLHASTSIPKSYGTNLWSQLQTFTNGIVSTASSTIGNGAQAGGLIISGGATTTGLFHVQGAGTSTFSGNLNVLGQLSVGPGSIYLNDSATSTFSAGLQTTALNITSSAATSTFANGLNLSGGCFAINGACLGSTPVSQITSTYTVDSGSADISIGDIVAYINGNAHRDQAPLLPGTPAATNAVSSSYISAAALDSTHFVVAYRYASNGYVYAVACSVSGKVFTCGSPTGLNLVSSLYVSVAALDSGKFVVAYRNDSTNYANAVVSTVSGTTITPGTPVALNSIISAFTSVSALDSGKFVVAYRGSSNYPNAVVSTVSGTTITPGTPAVLTSATAQYISADALDSGKFVVAYQNTGTTYANAVVSTVSGTTITPGTPVALNGINSAFTSVSALDSGKFVVAYRNDSSTLRANAVVSTVSGTTITPGTPADVDNAANAYATSVAATDASHFVIAYRYGNTSFAYVVEATVSGTTVTAGTPTILSTAGADYTSVAALNSSYFVAAYPNSSNYATAVVGQLSPYSSSNVLGMATNAASPGGTVTVASNGIVTGLSGLTAGSAYYWSSSVGLTTTGGSNYPVGLALTSSSILLNSEFGTDQADQFFGDMIFANDFRITEGWEYPQSLIWKNQLGREIARLDETGNFTIAGAFRGAFDALLSTTTAEELISAATGSTASWGGALAEAGAALKARLAGFGSAVISVIGDAVYATVGVFDRVFAREVHTDRIETDELCVGSTCLTEPQLKSILEQAGQSAGLAAPSPPPENGRVAIPPAAIEPEEIESEEINAGDATAQRYDAPASVPADSPIDQTDPALAPRGE